MKKVVFVYVGLCVFFSWGQRPSQEPNSSRQPTGEKGNAPPTPGARSIDGELAEEVKRLIGDLGNATFSTREAATQRLRKIGAPALNGLREAAKSKDGEVRRRAQYLLRVIRAPRDEVVNGARFRLLSDRRWVVPNVGRDCAVRLELEITNLGTERRRFKLLDTIDVRLEDEVGNLMPFYGGRTALLRRSSYSPVLGPGDSYVVKHFEAKLRFEQAGKLCFGGKDGFGGFWGYSDLRRGRYFLSLAYANREVLEEKGVPLWVGKVETNPFEIELK